MKTIVLLLTLTCTAFAERAFLTGVDANYALDMEARGKTWAAADGTRADPFELLARAGADSIRIRLWTGDEGMNGLKYATETARRAQKAGLKPYLVIFLSENWADYVKQPVPKIWKDLSFEEKVKAVEAYSHRVTKHFADAGVSIDLYEIGNEIDFGICGEFEQEWPKRVSLDYMRARIWPKMAGIISAAQRGVRTANPQAKFMLHLTQWENVPYSSGFFKFMVDSGVQLDYTGFSYFPTNQKEEMRPLAVLEKHLAELHAATVKPAIICEFAYPSMPEFPGQFATWNKPIPGYALDEAGQKQWLSDFLSMARRNAHLAGAFYWSPEWYASEADMWKAFALFDEKGVAKPALTTFAGKPPATQPQSIKVYLGNLHAHTAYSDGAGTPEQAYTYARDVGQLGFLAITEHNHLIGGENVPLAERNALYSGPLESSLIMTANRFTQNGKFVALYGQEFSSMSKGNHVNVYDIPSVIDVPNGKFDELLAWLDKHRDSSGQVAIVQFNHPSLGRPGKGIERNEYGRDDFKDDAGWVAAMGKVTHLIEIINGEPLPGVLGRRSAQLAEEHYRMFLQLGFRVGPVGDQDNHKIDFGTLTDTRTGILAPELTKQALLAALRKQHVYASEDRNLKLIVRVNGRLCGDEIDFNGGELIVDYELTDPDEPAATYSVDVFTGKVGGELAKSVKTVSIATPAGRIEGISMTQPGEFVYFRLTQKSESGTDRLWTAPVWLGRN